MVLTHIRTKLEVSPPQELLELKMKKKRIIIHRPLFFCVFFQKYTYLFLGRIPLEVKFSCTCPLSSARCYNLADVIEIKLAFHLCSKILCHLNTIILLTLASNKSRSLFLQIPSASMFMRCLMMLKNPTNFPLKARHCFSNFSAIKPQCFDLYGNLIAALTNPRI